MTCLEARRLVPRFLAMDLSTEVERELREHLAACPDCRSRLAQREPELPLAWTLAAAPGPEDEAFVGEVMAQIHQRRLERRLGGRRGKALAAAAALLLTLLGGTAVIRRLSHTAPPVVAQSPSRAARVRPVPSDPAFVEVDNAGVRLYQLTPASQSRGTIQVAFIVDPHLEL
jgi:hypothetical protein